MISRYTGSGSSTDCGSMYSSSGSSTECGSTYSLIAPYSCSESSTVCGLHIGSYAWF